MIMLSTVLKKSKAMLAHQPWKASSCIWLVLGIILSSKADSTILLVSAGLKLKVCGVLKKMLQLWVASKVLRSSLSFNLVLSYLFQFMDI